MTGSDKRTVKDLQKLLKHNNEVISDDMIGRSMLCPCGTIVDEMLVSGMDDDFTIRPITQKEIK